MAGFVRADGDDVRHLGQACRPHLPAGAARSTALAVLRAVSENGATISAAHPSLASTMRRASGAFSRTAVTRSRSPSPVSLSLSKRTVRVRLRACPHRLRRIKADGVRRCRPAPAPRDPRDPMRGFSACFASMSQNAQSSALRAAPGGSAVLKSGPVERPALDIGGQRLQRRDDTCLESRHSAGWPCIRRDP